MHEGIKMKDWIELKSEDTDNVIWLHLAHGNSPQLIPFQYLIKSTSPLLHGGDDSDLNT